VSLSFNPRNGQSTPSHPPTSPDEVADVVATAAAASGAVAAAPAAVRASWLGAIAHGLKSQADELITLADEETALGSPRLTAELAGAARSLRFYGAVAAEGSYLGATIDHPTHPDSGVPAKPDLRRVQVPLGPVAVFGASNFPFGFGVLGHDTASALAAGCPMVIKPADETPLSATALAELAGRAGLPDGVLNVVVGKPEMVGELLTSDPRVRALSFTGSTAVGKLLMSASARTVKKVALELGGNAPLIVFDDADLDAAVAGAMASKFRNAGQTCVCANRVLVQSGIHDAFVERFRAAIDSLVVGPGFAAGSQQGPLISAEAVAKVQRHIADAVGRGAQVAAGGKPHPLGPQFFEPTLLTGVTRDMLIAQEETFGPVAPVIRFDTEREAVDIANDTPFGLASYFFTRDLGRTWRVGEALEFGVVGVNTGLISYEGAPFGGVKESGLGREGSRYGIDEFTDLKYLCIDGLGA